MVFEVEDSVVQDADTDRKDANQSGERGRGGRDDGLRYLSRNSDACESPRTLMIISRGNLVPFCWPSRLASLTLIMAIASRWLNFISKT